MRVSVSTPRFCRETTALAASVAGRAPITHRRREASTANLAASGLSSSLTTTLTGWVSSARASASPKRNPDSGSACT